MIGAVGASWAIETLIASTLLMVLVLVLRAPVRRAFGAHVAYALWALPVLRLALPPLPAAWRDSPVASFHDVALAPMLRAAEPVTVLLGSSAAQADAAPNLLWTVPLLAMLWLAGAGGFFAWHALAHRRFCARMLAGVGQRVELDGVSVIESDAATGPLAFGIVRRYVAFPRDFAERYEPEERDLALAHELGHHERGDLIANWVALAVLALHWFNPIAWRAFRAFRADQEIANDARVLAGMNPMRRHTYACAIVKAAHPALYGAVAATCHLNTIDDLKGRLRVLTTQRTSRLRLAGGGVVIAALTLGGLGLTASGSAAAERVRSGVETATGVDIAALVPPPVPAAPVVPAAPPVADVPAAPQPPLRADAPRARRLILVATPDAPEAPLPPVAPAPPQPHVAPQPPAVPEAFRGTDGTFVVTTAKDGKQIVRHGRYVQLGKRGAVTIVGDDGTVSSVPWGSRARSLPDVRSLDCGARAPADRMTIEDEHAGRHRILVCRDRIAAAQARGAAAAARGAQIAANSATIQRTAYARALASLRANRESLLRNRDMPAETRQRALDGMDSAIAKLDGDLARLR